jgi:glyoxylase-like metal-dependent hydrolase (beta-lactamase superfamily II)
MPLRRRLAFTVVAVTGLATLLNCGRGTATLESAMEALGADGVTSIEISGAGRWFQFGQAPNPALPWPAFDVSSYTATIDYDTASARVRMVRRPLVEPDRIRPAPIEQRPVQLVSGRYAWNTAGPAGSAPATEPAPQPQPAAAAERTMEIWTTPHGFLRAAVANHATAEPADDGTDVSFVVDGKYRYIGHINRRDQIERIRTWIDTPVLGDTAVETTFSDYRNFGGVMFPARIVRSQGGHPVLDLTVSAVTTNPAVHIEVPERVRATPIPIGVDTEPLAAGVYYLRGGSHHSVAIEQRDHLVLVEAPLDEARSRAVIDAARAAVPNKPIRYVINTHAHFDHAGGLRTYVAEGATIVTHALNVAYYQAAWSAPRTIAPDLLATNPKPAAFEAVAGKQVLTDGVRPIEVHEITGNGHNDAFLMVYLPAEQMLIEADAYTPGPVNAPAPATPNPYTVNLYENIERLKLRVRTIAALHGPRLTTLGELRDAAGHRSTATQ